MTTDEHGPDCEVCINQEIEELGSDVVELDPSDPKATVCGACGRAWDDSVSTSRTPTPSSRCPFEADHEYGEEPTSGSALLSTWVEANELHRQAFVEVATTPDADTTVEQQRRLAFLSGRAQGLKDAIDLSLTGRSAWKPEVDNLWNAHEVGGFDGVLVSFGDGTDADTWHGLFGRLVLNRYSLHLTWRAGDSADVQVEDWDWTEGASPQCVRYRLFDSETDELSTSVHERPLSELVGIHIY